jgi:hypothetical protein
MTAYYCPLRGFRRFPNATFSIARDEYEFWSGPYGSRELMRAIVNPGELRIVKDLDQERLQFIEDTEEIFRALRRHTSPRRRQASSWCKSASPPDVSFSLQIRCTTTRNLNATGPFKLFGVCLVAVRAEPPSPIARRALCPGSRNWLSCGRPMPARVSYAMSRSGVRPYAR